MLGLLAKTASLSLMAIVALDNFLVVTGQTAPVTATINISRDSSTMKITFAQSGDAPLPADITPGTAFFPSGQLFRTFFGDSLGFVQAPSSNIQEFIIPVSRTNSDMTCVSNTGSPINTQTSAGIPSLLANALFEGASNLFLPLNYGGTGNGLTGTAESTNPVASMDAIGLNECTTCFFEYDVNNDGMIDASDAAIVWNVGSNDGTPCPTQSPSSQPSLSSQPSFEPSVSNQPSVEPSTSTLGLKKSKTKSPGKGTKSPGKGRGKGMTKSPVQTCFQTSSAGKGKRD